MQIETRPGNIITFYSYKGGTGRSMALANMAWILATNRRKVFVIDWDLEAPGLHRYFRPFLIDRELTASNGLIDIVHRYVDTIIASSPDGTCADTPEFVNRLNTEAMGVIDEAITLNHKFPDGGFIDFLPAGRQAAAYAERVNTFNWSEFYGRFGGGMFLEAVKTLLRKEYDYILIDSRTGVSDTSGISTVQMPDTLAVCFTYNNQSIAGAAAIARSVSEARAKLKLPNASEQSDQPLVPFRIFPIPTRVEQGERTKLRIRQHYARREFEPMLDHVPEHLREQYWNDVEIPYIPFHAYEETLAAITDSPTDLKLILGAVRRITERVTFNEVTDYQLNMEPEQLRKTMQEFGATPYDLALTEDKSGIDDKPVIEQVAEHQLAAMPHTLLPAARKFWKRMVELRPGGDREAIAAAQVDFDTLSPDEKIVATQYLQAGVLRIRQPSSLQLSPGSQILEATHENTLRNWKTLQGWIDADQQFLTWRTQLSDGRRQWEHGLKRPSRLLDDTALDAALAWMRTHGSEVALADSLFIDESLARQNRIWAMRQTRKGMALAFGTLVLTIVPITIALWQSRAADDAHQQLLAALAAKRPASATPTSAATPADSAPATSTDPEAQPLLPLPSQGVVIDEKVRRKQISVVYFHKPQDSPALPYVLEQLGYRLVVTTPRLQSPTNTIWFGCQSPLSSQDAQLLAKTVMKIGVRLQKIAVFEGGNRNEALVQVGANSASASLPALSETDVASFDLDSLCGRDTKHTTAQQ